LNVAGVERVVGLLKRSDVIGFKVDAGKAGGVSRAIDRQVNAAGNRVFVDVGRGRAELNTPLASSSLMVPVP
jgi:hypothetical protein